MKKTAYYLVSIALVVVASIILIEITLQILPIVYRTLPNINNNKQYVYIIGESSAYGEPYAPKISYYKILDYMLDGKIDNKKIEFIQLAESGSYVHDQFYKYFIYKYMHPFRKGIVFIYCGKNDWNKENKNCDLPKLLQYNVFSLVNDFFLIYKNFQDHKSFQYNYERIILLAKKFGDDIFVSTIEGNYAGFMPHLNSNDNIYKKKFHAIDKAILKGNYQKALSTLKKMLLIQNIDKSWVLYRIGKIYEFTGKNKEANDNFIKSVGFYPDLRPTQYQNDVIRELANKYNVELIDIFEELYNSGKVIGFNFYMDNQHLNLKTYTMIARLFVDAVSKKYNVTVNIKRYNSDEKEIFEYFHFNKHDKYEAYRYSLDTTLVHSKEKDNANVYVFEQVDEYLKQIDLLNPYDKKRKKIIMSFYGMMCEALKGNKEKVDEIFKTSNLINEDRMLIEARPCDWEEYNKWVSAYLGLEDFFDLSKRDF